MQYIANQQSDLPKEVFFVIVKFLPVYERFGFSEEIDTSTYRLILNAKYLLRRAFYNWAVDYRAEMDVNQYRISKSAYKRFYPLAHRRTFLEHALDYLADEQDRAARVMSFNEAIDELTEDELYVIGL